MYRSRSFGSCRMYFIPRVACPSCLSAFCFDCDAFIHTHLHVCPGCEAGGGGRASFFLAFYARVTGGTLAAGDDASDAAFFALDALPELAFSSTSAVVARLSAAGA